MGLFDNVKCDLETPWPEAKDFGWEWQTKSTDDPFGNRYEIRSDGTLWGERYTKRIEQDAAAPLGFWIHHENLHWEPEPFTGEFEIHHAVVHKDRPGHFWYSVLFWLRDGVVKDAVFHKHDSTERQ